MNESLAEPTHLELQSNLQRYHTSSNVDVDKQIFNLDLSYRFIVNCFWWNVFLSAISKKAFFSKRYCFIIFIIIAGIITCIWVSIHH